MRKKKPPSFNYFYISVLVSLLCNIAYATEEELHQEITPDHIKALESPESLSVSLLSFYEEFKEDGVITIFIAAGATYDNEAFERVAESVTYEGTVLDPENQTIEFVVDGTTYHVKVSNDRNEYIQAYSQYEVVMYYGHSRYGQGPAIGGIRDYFRMGNQFPVIETDVRGPYFQREPILDQDIFPLFDVVLDGMSYNYQYRGAKYERSYLEEDSYTVRVPGYDKDFREAEVLPKKQIFYYNSCSNVHYFKEPIRNRFPNENQKIVFGTDYDVWLNSAAGARAAVVFIEHLVSQAADTDTIVEDAMFVYVNVAY